MVKRVAPDLEPRRDALDLLVRHDGALGVGRRDVERRAEADFVEQIGGAQIGLVAVVDRDRDVPGSLVHVLPLVHALGTSEFRSAALRKARDVGEPAQGVQIDVKSPFHVPRCAGVRDSCPTASIELELPDALTHHTRLFDVRVARAGRARVPRPTGSEPTFEVGRAAP